MRGGMRGRRRGRRAGIEKKEEGDKLREREGDGGGWSDLLNLLSLHPVQ